LKKAAIQFVNDTQGVKYTIFESALVQSGPSFQAAKYRSSKPMVDRLA